jgi:hypothetical protein
MLPLSEEEYRFIAENYLTSAGNQFGAGALARSIDYRKFLSDLKLYGQEAPKTL